MGPAMAFVDNYLEESQLITANTAVSDPAIGRLLAFGIAKKPDYGGNSESKINVAAYACGETGSELGAYVRRLQQWALLTAISHLSDEI